MPKDSRALTRAARARAARTGEPYTAARAMEVAIRERVELLEETPEEAEAVLTDPANETLCEVCGWTMGMICPECSGCGCDTGRCTGWRHAEYDGPDEEEATSGYGQEDCEECGGMAGPYDECVCQ